MISSKAEHYQTQITHQSWGQAQGWSMIGNMFKGESNVDINPEKFLVFPLDPKADKQKNKALKIIKEFVESNPKELPNGFLRLAYPLLEDNGLI